MNPKQFLTIGGVVLVLVGVLGFIGIIGPTEKDSIFGATWWFDNAENYAHTILGIVGLIAAFALPGSLQKPLVMVLGLVGIFFGVYNIFTDQFMGAHLQQHADTALHFAVGIWALAASMMSKGAPVASPSPAPQPSSFNRPPGM